SSPGPSWVCSVRRWSVPRSAGSERSRQVSGSGARGGGALPPDLVERDGAGDGRVQGGRGTADGDLRDHVARLPPAGAHAHGLVPDDDQGRAGEVLCGQLAPSRLVEAEERPSLPQRPP